MFWLPANQKKALRYVLTIVAVLAAGVLLAWLLPPLLGVRGMAGYLPFHTLLETISIVIAMLVFAVGWNAYSEKIPGNVVWLACAFFGVGILDFTHAMSYAGMPDLVTPSGPEKAIDFWLTARTLAALALLAAAVMPWRKLGSMFTRYVLLLAVIAFVVSVQWLILFHKELTPATFIPGKGLTTFKVVYEYVLISINLLTAGLLWVRLRQTESVNVAGLFGAVCVMAMSEFYFTLYADVTDIFNLLGHIYKVIAYLFIYQAIFVSTIKSPYRQLQVSQDKLRATLDALPDLMFELDIDGRFIDYHAAQSGLLLLPAQHFLGKTVREVLPLDSAEIFMLALQEAMQMGSSRGKQIELLVGAETRWFELSVSLKKTKQGKTPSFVVLSRDISERKHAEEKIHILAHYDALTRLPNRRLLAERMQKAFAFSVRSEQLGAVLFLDLDNFKTINETKGYGLGDLLLVEVATRLESVVQGVGTIARIGSDEFVVLLDALAGDETEAATQAMQHAERLHNAVSQPYQLNENIYHITSSIGIAMFKGMEARVEDLLKHAEVAMQQAKISGRNSICFHDRSMQLALETRAELESDLRQVLDRKQLHLYYQIQVDSLNRPLGAEALIRWIHPEHGMISPAQFIPLAEETGLILPIGNWVLQTACAQLRVWQQNPLTRELVLAVNVSARQFYQADFVGRVQRALLKSGAKPAMLKLELTESMMLTKVDDTIAKMRELKLLGVKFSMDDFGTGYSSLQYIKRLPLDQLKIDQSFVRDIGEDANDAAIVQAIIVMSDALGLGVIAEGVETEAQRDFLDQRGCHAFQGYYFGRPVPIAEFEASLKKTA